MNVKHTALLTIVAVMLLVWQWTTSHVAKPPFEDGQSPEHQVHSVVTMVYAESGKPQYRLAAASSEHYPSMQRTDFRQPILQLFNEHSNISWVIQANRAHLTPQHQLYLSGNIGVTSVIAGSTLQKIDAQQMHINLLDHAIRSDQAVTLYGLHFTSSGNSMHGNLNQRTMTLFNQVKTHFAPPYALTR